MANINYTGRGYWWFPWTGTQWITNKSNVSDIPNTSAINSNNLYTVPYDCYVLSWSVSTIWIQPTKSYTGYLTTVGANAAGTPITTTDYAYVSTSGTNLGRIYSCLDTGNIATSSETTTTYAARDPDIVVELVKNPVNRNSPGTTIFSRSFPFTKVSGGVTSFLTTGDNWNYSYSGTNAGNSQLTAGDTLAVVMYRDTHACSTTNAIGGNAIGLWLETDINVSFDLKLARR